MTSDPRINQLDGWRGVSVFFVIVCHIAMAAGLADTPRTVAGVLSVWAVNVFFVISGFIITKLAMRERLQNGTFSIRNFYIRRFFRIVPAYFIYLIFIAAAGSLSLIVQPLSEISTAATFMCNVPQANCGWFVGHTWTLAYEQQFYLIFPLMFALLAPRIAAVSALVFTILLAIPFVRFAVGSGPEWRLLAAMAPSFSCICAGVCVASHEPLVKRLSESRWSAYISIFVWLLLAAVLVLVAAEASPGSALAYIQLTFRILALPTCIAWIVGSSLHAPSGRLATVLTAKPVLFLGTISYSLYLWQQVFTGSPTLYAISNPLLMAPLMLVVAVASYRFIERPSVRLGKRLIDILETRRNPALP